MIKLYPNRVRKALLTLTVASFSTISLFAQCPTGAVTAVDGGTYGNGTIVCGSNIAINQSITLNSGAQLVIPSNANFKGTINAANNVQIYVQANATFSPKNVNNFGGTITNYGTANINFDLGDGSSITNANVMTINGSNFNGNVNITNTACGTLDSYGSMNFSSNASAFSNSGLATINSGMTLAAGSQLTNRGKMYVYGTYLMQGKITNDGYLDFGSKTGASGISGTDSLINKNVVEIDASATVDKPIRNDGLFWVTGSASFPTAGKNFSQTNSVSYFRIDGSLSYANVIGGTGAALIGGAKAGTGQFLLATATTTIDASNFVPSGANAAKPCGLDESSVILPIVLQNFTAKASGNAAQLNWSTVSELNGKAMIVQHSTDGTNFEDIATVASTTNSSIVQNYSYIDNNVAAGVNYYRLKLVSSDAPVAYSAVVAVKFNVTAEQEAISVFPNPFTDHFTVKFADVKGGGNVVAKLYNAQGAVILVQSFNSAASVTINTPANLAKGVYVLEISANGEKYYHRLMKL
jgi:hypothetical protein